MAARLRDSALAPPDAAALAAACGVDEKRARALLALLAEEGTLVRAGDAHFHRDAVDAARRAALEVADARGELAVPLLRDRLATTRKYLIPLLELFDARGWTVRRGDKRFVVRSAAERPA
jgi:selenocysteine-specific elongation factor